MAQTVVGIPIVEVVTPDGATEFWAAAVAHGEAVTAVKRAVPLGSAVKPSIRRFPVGPRIEGIRRGEVRRIQP